MPKLASFRVKLVNFLGEKGRFSFLLRSLHFGSNRLMMEITTVIALTVSQGNVGHIYDNFRPLNPKSTLGRGVGQSRVYCNNKFMLK